MLEEIGAFIATLSKVLRASANTVKSYRRDLLSFRRVPDGSGGGARPRMRRSNALTTIEADHIRDYLTHLMKRASRATAQRHLSAIKAFFRHREVTTGGPNPSRGAALAAARKVSAVGARRNPRSPRSSATTPEEPDRAGWRDRAMAETLYSSRPAHQRTGGAELGRPRPGDGHGAGAPRQGQQGAHRADRRAGDPSAGRIGAGTCRSTAGRADRSSPTCAARASPPAASN